MSTIRLMTRAVSSIGSARPSWLSPVVRFTTEPPIWYMPASKLTRVRVDGLLEDHRQRAVDQRRVLLVVLEALLDRRRALEQVGVLLGAEVLELQVVLDQGHAGFHAGCGGEEILDQRAQDRDDLPRLVGAHDQRRQQADHAVGGDADHQAGLGGAAEQRAAGRSSSMPIIRPWPRTSTTPATPGELLLEAVLQHAADRGGVLEQALLFHDAQRLDAGAHRERVAAEGGAVVARAEHVGRLRAADDRADRHARAEALGERHHVGADAGPLVREPLAGAAHAALHLVEHQQPAALVADPAHFLADRPRSSGGCRLRPGSPRGRRRRRSGSSPRPSRSPRRRSAAPARSPRPAGRSRPGSWRCRWPTGWRSSGRGRRPRRR